MIEIIRFAISHLTVIALALAITFAVIKYISRPEFLFSQELHYWLLLLPVGLCGIVNFVLHAFFPKFAASYIGWEVSPFQFEVACTNLAMGLVGLFAYARSKSYCLAATIFVSTFLWGTSIGHIREMVINKNFFPGNTGMFFFTNLIIPFLLILTLSIWINYSKRTF